MNEQGNSMRYFIANMIVLMLLLLMSTTFSACKQGGKIKFNPDFYVGDSKSQSIISEHGEAVFCEDQQFEQFACLHEDKIKELKSILITARIPYKNKARITAEIEDLERYIHEQKDSE